MTTPTLSPKTTEILSALRANYECVSTGPEGDRWGCVYLDSAIPEGMSYRAFAGHLSVLKEAGLYQPVEAGFGDVLLA
jgi:DNA-binding transcriptional ArsR family regulator